MDDDVVGVRELDARFRSWDGEEDQCQLLLRDVRLDHKAQDVPIEGERPVLARSARLARFVPRRAIERVLDGDLRDLAQEEVRTDRRRPSAARP